MYGGSSKDNSGCGSGQIENSKGGKDRDRVLGPFLIRQKREEKEHERTYDGRQP